MTMMCLFNLIQLAHAARRSHIPRTRRIVELFKAKKYKN